MGRRTLIWVKKLLNFLLHDLVVKINSHIDKIMFNIKHWTW